MACVSYILQLIYLDKCNELIHICEIELKMNHSMRFSLVSLVNPIACQNQIKL